MKKWLPATFVLLACAASGQMAVAQNGSFRPWLAQADFSGESQQPVIASVAGAGGSVIETASDSFMKLPSVSVRHAIKAPLARVWASWNDFGGIYKFHPALKHSRLLPGSPATGVGCTRQCDMKDGKNWVRERIVAYVPEQSQVIDLYDSTMPLKRARAFLELKALSVDETEVVMTMRFEPKMGFLGRLMVPMMKMQFKKMLNSVLLANDTFVTQGKALGG